MSGLIPSRRAMWLLAGIRLRRLRNQYFAVFAARRGGGASRPATPARRREPWLITALATAMMLFGFGSIAHHSMLNLHRALDASDGLRGLAPPFSDALMRGLAMQLTLLVVVVALAAIATRELAQTDWDIEWLVTLPMRMRTLLWGRVVERSLTQPLGFIAFVPACTLIAWCAGHRWSAVPLGLACALSLLMLCAMLRTLVDTGLRLVLAPSRLRNLQGFGSLASVLLLYLSMSAGFEGGHGPIFDLAAAFPAWAAWTPPGLVVDVLARQDATVALTRAVLLVAETGVLALGSVRVLEWTLRNGVVAASARESTRGGARAASASALRAAPEPAEHNATVTGETWSGRLLARLATPVQRRELRLLGRDRNFLVQTLVLPLVVVGSQLFFNGKLSGTSVFETSVTTTATVAFGLAAYTLLSSAFQTLHTEGQALWMLYTFPRSLADVLAQKARMWSVLALLYPAILFALAAAWGQQAGAQLIGAAAIVLVGVPIYAHIAVSLGVFGCDPLAQDTQTRIKPAFLYLYTLLAGFFSYALYAQLWSQKLVLIVLSALLAQALWQKACDALPYLLDPTSSPPQRVSTSDGLIGAMMFFVLQALIAILLKVGKEDLSEFQVLMSYAIAGLLSFGLVRLTYWRAGTRGVPALLAAGVGLRRSLVLGLSLGMLAAGVGLAYLYALRHLGADGVPGAPVHSGLTRTLWLLALAVVAAPLCEEFLFRGLIFNGLRRTWSLWHAMLASAAVFAIVHPPLSIVPVFVLGLCAAYAYERSRALLAPMLAHATYNAVVVGSSFI